MRIDLFTLIAQIINFLILVGLLRYFLYKRIIKAMDEREKRIASRLEEAGQKRKEAEQEAESYRKQKQELQDQREDILSKAKEDAGAQRKELIKRARDETEESKARWYEAIQQQKDSFLTDIRRRAGEQIYAVARRALKDLANDDLEQHIIDTFIKRIQRLEEHEREAIKQFAGKRQEGVVVNSAFEIPQEMQERITEAVRAQIADNIEIRFKKSSDLICGVELNAHGRKIAWSLDSYLGALEERLSRALEEMPTEEGEIEERKEASKTQDKGDEEDRKE